jgi:hypothetical protein
MRHKLLLALAFVFIIGTAFSQDEDDSTSNFGVNSRHYVHGYINTGFMLSPSEGEGGDIIYGKSHSITPGIRYKLKLNNVFAVGASLNYTYNIWHIKQTDQKVIPNDVLYDKQKLLNHNIGADAFLRFNIGKRGNTIGNFIDIGAYGEWAYRSSHKYYVNVDMTGDPRAFDYYVTIQKHLSFINKLNYGLTARLGYGRIIVFGRYRMTDMFTQNFKDAISSTELPRLIIGIELGLHK